MKRFSFLISIFLISLSITVTNAQEIRLKTVTFGGAPDVIFPGPVIFKFEYVFGPTETRSVSNGFRVYSPDGALWGGGSVNTAIVSTNLAEFDGNISTSVLSNDGQLADTVTISGSDLLAPGIPANSVRTVVEIFINPTLSSDGKHICIDSCWFPPDNDWLWSDDGGSLAVEWGGGIFAPVYSDGPNGGYCFQVLMESPTRPVINNCPLNLTCNHCSLATFDFDASDPDGDPVTFSLVSGPGSINASTGVWTYTPTLADVGTNPQIVVRPSDWGATGYPCTVNLSFSNFAPTMTGGCGSTTIMYANHTSYRDFSASSGDCDPISYSITSVVPAPVGTYSINSATGLVAFTPTPLDGGVTYVFTVCASDGFDESCCSASFDMMCCDAPICGNIDSDMSDLVNIVDVTRLVNYLFQGGEWPQPLDIANVNCSTDNKVNIVDLTYLVNFLFMGGAAPCAGC
jgi:hypothetical protein